MRTKYASSAWMICGPLKTGRMRLLTQRNRHASFPQCIASRLLEVVLALSESVLAPSNTPEWTNFNRPLFPNSAQQRPLSSHFKVHYYSNIYTSLTLQTISLTYCNIFITTHIRAKSCIFWTVSFSLNAKHLKYCDSAQRRMETLLLFGAHMQARNASCKSDNALCHICFYNTIIYFFFF